VRADCGSVANRDLAYSMSGGGVAFADLQLSLQCADGLARVAMTMRNRGLAAFIAGDHRTDLTAEVEVGKGAPRPSHFSALYTKPDRTRETELTFAADGSLADLVVRHRGRERESPVSPALRDPSIDPLAALLQLSDWLAHDPAPDAAMTLPVFDGRKRADLETVYRGRTTVEVAGKKRDAYHLTAALLGLSGFEEGDMLVTMPGQQPIWIDAYASIEPMPMPLLIRSRDSAIESSIELVSEEDG
jgi:hypothetical protein